MILKLILIFLAMWSMISISEITKRNGFKKLEITREIDENVIIEGEVFSITTIVENNKMFPISFLVINELIPEGIRFNKDVVTYKSDTNLCHISRYKLGRYERCERIYELVWEKRGAYILKNIQITIGDVFGLSAKDVEKQNYVEVLVYPRLKDISSYKFVPTNIQGENSVLRWILKDTLCIKGIREYNIEDSMKDIHWKSSLKMNKLMVKEYDATSDEEVVIILNVQCGEPAWAHITDSIVENGIRVAISLANKSIKQGIPTGLWTNANIISISGNLEGKVKSDLSSFKRIMELAARMDTGVRIEFSEYLKQQSNYFKRNSTYIVITPFLNEESIILLSKLCKNGFKFKMIDVSENGDTPNITGVEKIIYKGETTI